MNALEIYREINEITAMNMPSGQAAISEADKVAAMAALDAELVAEVEAEKKENERRERLARMEANRLEDEAKEAEEKAAAEAKEKDVVEAKPTVKAEVGTDAFAGMLKGYRGKNDPALMRVMFTALLKKQPESVKEVRRIMCEAVGEKSVPARFVKKGLDKLTEANFIEWGGDMKSPVTWIAE
jgi:hypothetical protein